MRQMISLLSLIVTLSAAFAYPTVTARVDVINGQATQTLIVNLPNNTDIWAIGINTPNPTLRAGKTWEVADSLKLGGYIGERAGDIFVTPTAVYAPNIGNGKALVWLEYQHYLTADKSDTLTLSEARILWPVGHGIEIGLAANGTILPTQKLYEGLALKAKVSDQVTFYGRWTKDGKDEFSRLNLTYNF